MNGAYFSVTSLNLNEVKVREVNVFLCHFKNYNFAIKRQKNVVLRPLHIYTASHFTLKAPITTATDDKLCYIFTNFRKNKA